MEQTGTDQDLIGVPSFDTALTDAESEGSPIRHHVVEPDGIQFPGTDTFFFLIVANWGYLCPSVLLLLTHDTKCLC